MDRVHFVDNAAKAVRIRRGGAGARAVGHGPAGGSGSAASATSSSTGVSAAAVNGAGGGARAKNSLRQAARIGVEPLPNSDDDARRHSNDRGRVNRSETTPTSSTITIPYRPPDSAEQHPLIRTPRSRRNSENTVDVPPLGASTEREEEIRPAASSSLHDSADGKDFYNQAAVLSFESLRPDKGDEML